MKKLILKVAELVLIVPALVILAGTFSMPKGANPLRDELERRTAVSLRNVFCRW